MCGFVLAAVADVGDALEFATEDLRSSREVVLAAVKINGMALLHAAQELRSDRDVVLAAVMQNGHALEWAAEEIRADPDFVLEAVSVGGWALAHADEEIRAQREVVLAAVKHTGRALRFAASRLQADREVVLAAVETDGFALEYASEELRADRQVVLTAVMQNGWALQFACRELMIKDDGLCFAAARQDRHVIGSLFTDGEHEMQVYRAAGQSKIAVEGSFAPTCTVLILEIKQAADGRDVIAYQVTIGMGGRTAEGALSLDCTVGDIAREISLAADDQIVYLMLPNSDKPVSPMKELSPLIDFIF